MSITHTAQISLIKPTHSGWKHLETRWNRSKMMWIVVWCVFSHKHKYTHKQINETKEEEKNEWLYVLRSVRCQSSVHCFEYILMINWWAHVNAPQWQNILAHFWCLLQSNKNNSQCQLLTHNLNIDSLTGTFGKKEKLSSSRGKWGQQTLCKSMSWLNKDINMLLLLLSLLLCFCRRISAFAVIN